MEQEIDYYKHYGVERQDLSYDFIAGLITGEGTFYWTKNKGTKKTPAFALRMHIRDFDLLVNVRYSLGLKERVYEYIHNGRHYAFLFARSFDSLRKVIDNIYPKLGGYKRLQFIEWFQKFNDETLEARYITIYNIYKVK